MINLGYVALDLEQYRDGSFPVGVAADEDEGRWLPAVGRVVGPQGQPDFAVAAALQPSHC